MGCGVLMKHIAHCTVIFLGFGVVSDIEDTILWYLYFCGKSNGLTELLKICKIYIYIQTLGFTGMRMLSIIGLFVALD